MSGISIVIPAFNEQSYLVATLTSVNAARDRLRTETGAPSEIIVVDNASTDLTADLARAHGATVLHHEIRNIASVRNRGIEGATHDLIVTIDADCTLETDALIRIWQHMQNPRNAGAALGLTVHPSSVLTRLIQLAVSLLSGCQGATFVFRKHIARAFGGFREDRLVAEDSLFARAMRRHARANGLRFEFLRSVQVHTVDRKNLSWRKVPSLLRQVLRAFRGAAQTPDELSFWYRPQR